MIVDISKDKEYSPEASGNLPFASLSSFYWISWSSFAFDWTRPASCNAGLSFSGWIGTMRLVGAPGLGVVDV